MRRFTKLLHKLKRAPADPGKKRSVSLFETLEARRMLSGRGLTGYYFQGTDFTQRQFIREDTHVAFNWTGASSDVKDFNTSGFGVHWAGRVLPKFSETYNFYTRTTGGVRLWVNNRLIIDDPTVHPLKDNKGSIALTAGIRYDIRIEYFDTSSTSRFELHWMSRRQAREVVPTNRMFAAEVDTTPPNAASHVRPSYVTDSAIKVIWKPVADPLGVVYDTYIGRTRLGSTTDTQYTRSGRVPETTYSFTVRAIDFAGNIAASNPIMVTTASAPLPGSGRGVAGKYYSASDFSQFALTRTDANLNFTWNSSPVATGDQAFSTKWDGKLLAQYDELYTFFLQTDGRAKLWLGGQLIVNVSAAGEHLANMKLRAGSVYDLRIEYQHQPGRTARFGLSWSSLSTKKQVIPSSQLFPAFEDKTAPTAPRNLRLQNIGDDDAAIGWDPASDDVGVARYNVFRDSQFIGSTAGTNFYDTGLQPGKEYKYSVIAFDGANRASGASNLLIARTVAPAAPRSALAGIAARDFTSSSGVVRNGNVVDHLDAGDWIKFSNIDFGAGVKSVVFTLGVTHANARGKIELRLGSVDGPVIGTHLVQATGSYETMHEQQLNVTGASGLNDLYLVFRDGTNIAALQQVRFSTQQLKRIMVLGDSITASVAGRLSYRHQLWQKLQANGYAVDFVGSLTDNFTGAPGSFDFDQNHEGHAGWRYDHVLPNIADWMNLHQPDIVLIHLGTNDLWDGDTVANTVLETGELIDAIRASNPSVSIVLSQIIPLMNYEQKIIDYNALLPALVDSRQLAGSPLTLVDMHTGYSLADDTYDGVHPDESGEIKLADKLYDALVPLLS